MAIAAFMATRAFKVTGRSFHDRRSIYGNSSNVEATAAFMATGPFKAIGRSFHGSRRHTEQMQSNISTHGNTVIQSYRIIHDNSIIQGSRSIRIDKNIHGKIT